MKKIVTLFTLYYSFFTGCIYPQPVKNFEDISSAENEIGAKECINFLYADENSIKLSEFEVKLSLEEKIIEILKLGRQEFYNKQLYVRDVKEIYASHFCFIDLNNDQALDVVYNGADGADSDLFIVWINSEGTYKTVVDTDGEIVNVSKKNGKFDFHLFAPPYAGEIFGVIKEVQIEGDFSKIEENIIYMMGTYFPKEYNFIAKLETINDDYNLRISPMIKDLPCEEAPDGIVYCGNQYLKLKKGAHGKAISKFKDDIGRVWWFTLIEDNKEFHLGWLSSRFVKKI
jgi:hypothetical protein